MDAIEYVTTAPEFAPLWVEVRRRLGHSAAHMSKLKLEFVRALSVKDLAESGGMPTELDAVWHEAVLNTRYYAKLCKRLRGQFVHHSTESEANDEVARLSRVDSTVIAYRKRYREEPDERIWNADAEPEVRQREQLSRLHIKKMNGKSVTCMGISPATTIWQLKLIVQKQTGVPPDQQRIIFAGSQLDDKATCESYNIQQDSTLHLVERLRGC